MFLMQRISALCDVTTISHCQLMCSRLIIVSVQYEKISVTHCWASLIVIFAEELKLINALWCRSIQSALITYLFTIFVINAQQSLWSLLSHSLKDLMLLFCAYVSIITREVIAHCKSVFSNLLLFIFLIWYNIMLYQLSYFLM